MDERYMEAAINEAKLAAIEDEVPVGAVIVMDDEIIATGRNRREKDNNALAHAEIEAIAEACGKLQSWRLEDCDIYVTLEPCPMCAGAIINSRIRNVYYGAADPKAGCCGSVIDLFELPFNHKPGVTGGILQDECSRMLSEFFKNLRSRSNA